MLQKTEIYNDLRKISHDILNIIAHHRGITIEESDIWLMDIETFCMDDTDKREKILTTIEEKYQLNEEELFYVDSYTPIIQIALFIYLRDRKEVIHG